VTAEGTPADRFAIEHAHYREDLAMWALLADGVDGPILDLGAAAGRVSLHLASLGHRVVAVDSDPQRLRPMPVCLQTFGPCAPIFERWIWMSGSHSCCCP
jgi:SAM-dependent methyltransferase